VSARQQSDEEVRDWGDESVNDEKKNEQFQETDKDWRLPNL
jgi:hypothetical protein